DKSFPDSLDFIPSALPMSAPVSGAGGQSGSVAGAAEVTAPSVSSSAETVPAADGTSDLLSQADSSLIGLDQFRSDSRFNWINGRGLSVAVIDTGIDLNHPFFGPDNDHNGIADRIVYSYDFSGLNDPDASDTDGHGSNVASIVGSQDATFTGM